MSNAVGDLSTVSLRQETVAGTEDTGQTLHYLFVQSVKHNFDPKMIDVRVNTRSNIRVRKRVPTLGEPVFSCTGPITSDLIPVWPLIGLKTDGTGHQTPSPVTLRTGYEDVGSLAFPGMFVVKHTYSFDPRLEARWQFDFNGITPPTYGAAVAQPTLTMADPFVFSHLDPANLIGSTGRLDMQNLMLVLDYIYAKAPGNVKKASYAFMRFIELAVSFKVTVLHAGATEYNKMLQSASGAFLFSATQPSPATASVTWAIPEGKYDGDPIDGRSGQFVNEPLSGKAEDPAGLILVNFTATA